MKPLFKIREFAWAIVSEVEDWLYPYRTDATEPLWAENNDPTDDSVVTYLKAQSDANNDRIDRLQSEMLYVTSEVNKINNMLRNRNNEGQESSKTVVEESEKAS